MHEVWHLRNVIYSSIVRCHFKSIGKGGRFCYPLILNGGKNILIGDKFSMRERGRIEAIDLYQGVNYTPSIIIGDNVSVNQGSFIISRESIVIGNNTRVGEYVSIRDNDHEWRDKNTPILQQGFITNAVEIGSDVWIGRNVVISKGVKIGDGAVIGANAVITKNVNQYEVVVGNPGRVIKVRGE